MSDHEPEAPELSNSWQEIQPDVVYQSAEGRLVSFSKTQIQLGVLYDPIGKHLRAINKGLVPPKGNTGIVPSEQADYDFKSKVLGKGGDYAPRSAKRSAISRQDNRRHSPLPRKTNKPLAG